MKVFFQYVMTAAVFIKISNVYYCISLGLNRKLQDNKKIKLQCKKPFDKKIMEF